METVILENVKTYNSRDEEWEVFEEWYDETDPMVAGVWATNDTWEHLYTFQLFVREARKDE
jgi:hypothetical protein